MQELFKGWYKQDPEVYPPAATMLSLPAYGDFKVANTIAPHTNLLLPWQSYYNLG